MVFFQLLVWFSMFWVIVNLTFKGHNQEVFKSLVEGETKGMWLFQDTCKTARESLPLDAGAASILSNY